MKQHERMPERRNYPTDSGLAYLGRIKQYQPPAKPEPKQGEQK